MFALFDRQPELYLSKSPSYSQPSESLHYTFLSSSSHDCETNEPRHSLCASSQQLPEKPFLFSDTIIAAMGFNLTATIFLTFF